MEVAVTPSRRGIPQPLLWVRSFLRKEYWDVSPWIGVAGYAVAAGTGFFRMYNNRHWLTDVLTGAGIGILSTQAAYWLYPTITKTFFRKRYKNIFISPYFSKEEKRSKLSYRFLKDTRCN